MMNIAIFGGSFNPPHKAHLRLAEEFSKELCADKMLIIPTCAAPHKDSSKYASASDRLAMCRLLFPKDRFEVSELEINRQGKSYTIDTLVSLEKEYPGAKFYLIIGSDMLLSFHMWFRYEDILSKCTLCVMTRENDISVTQMRHYVNQTLRLPDSAVIFHLSAHTR